MSKKRKYIVIPPSLLKAMGCKGNKCILLAQIIKLDEESRRQGNKGCYASREYLADMLNVARPQTISNWYKELAEDGLIIRKCIAYGKSKSKWVTYPTAKALTLANKPFYNAEEQQEEQKENRQAEACCVEHKTYNYDHWKGRAKDGCISAEDIPQLLGLNKEQKTTLVNLMAISIQNNLCPVGDFESIRTALLD